MRNGAGKTTTMRVILGLDRPDAGTALVGGRPYRTLKHPLTRLGSLIDASAPQPSRSARGHLLWLARSQRLSSARVDEVIGQSGLGTVIRRRAGGYSLGMRQRLGSRRAARRSAGPHAGRAVQRHGSRWHARDARLPPLAGRGRVISDTTVADLIATASGDRLLLRTTAPAQVTGLLRSTGVNVEAAAPDALIINGISPERSVATLSEHAISFTEVSAQRVSLEQVYLDLTRGSVELRDA
jgi:ABC-2 type transport system ATP-binding protein